MLTPSHRLLFVVGPARSGTTYVMVQLNRSDQVFLLNELNSFQLGAEIPTGRNTTTFAEEFNRRKAQVGNTRQKGSFIPDAERYRSVEELFRELGTHYLVLGEKVALSGRPVDGRYPAERLFDFHLKERFHDYHLVLLRRPSETLHSTALKFPETPLQEHFERLLRSFERLFELAWVFPKARMMFYERLGEEAFQAVFDWLGLEWSAPLAIPYTPTARPDWSARRQELLGEVPALERLDRIYDELLASTEPSPFFIREESGNYQSGHLYDRIGSALRGLVEDQKEGRVFALGGAASGGGRTSNTCRVVLETLHPLAWESPDHLHPLGTRQDNYRSAEFTRKLLDLYAGLPLSVLDLGCAGGGFVKEITEAGHLAVGLEGSDYSLKHRRAEWATIPDRLFTCDCAQPFSLFLEEDGKRRPARFEVVTAWEFLEHIPEERLQGVLENVRRHLHPNLGLFIASVSLRRGVVDGIEYHATVRPEWWWRSLFLDHGFYPVDRALDYFGNDWVRGPSDEQNAWGSFHVVLTLSPAGPIVRRIDRFATEGGPYARMSQAELKQILAEHTRQLQESRQREENLLLELDRTRQSLNQLLAGRSAYTWPNLCRVAAQAIEHCREQGYRSVALYGAGEHTSRLLPIWEGLRGPTVVALVVSDNPGGFRFGKPVVAAAGPIPPEVQAVVPSSHTHESDMRRNWLSLHPDIPWVPLWELHETV